MCKASVRAKAVIQAEAGKNYDIGISSHGLGAFHPKGKTVEECVACVKNGTVMTFSKIPDKLRQEYGLGESEVATFMDTGDNYHDEVEFNGSTRVTLDELANCGIEACIGMPNTGTETSKKAAGHAKSEPVFA